MKSTFERHPDTQAVIDCLRSVNGEVSYSELARRVGLTSGRCKEVLNSARRALRPEKILFGTVRGYGLQRLSDQEKVKKSEDNKRRVGRAATRGLRELDTVEAFDLMPPRDQLVATTNRTIFSLWRQQARAAPKQDEPKAARPPKPDTSKIVNIKASK